MVATDLSTPVDIRRTADSRLSSVDLNNVVFGSTLADHVFSVEFSDGAWRQPRIMPYGHMDHGHAMSALHYGQAIFEGMKAYRGVDGKVRLFRGDAHWERMNRSAARMCMPSIGREHFVGGILELLRIDEAWVPSGEGSSLYLRPLMYACDEFIGVRPSATYRMTVMTSPANRYYTKAVKALASTEHIRAAEGGVGAAKCAGNYGLSMLAGKIAREAGFDVVVWLDAKNRKNIEEFSTMNAFFVIDGKIVTPTAGVTVLEGITRDSVLTLAREAGIPIDIRPISIDEIIEASQKGTLQEAFGTGTAATVAPLAQIRYKDTDIMLPAVESWKVGTMLAKKLDDIKYGIAPDVHGWMTAI